jgi:NAD(P)-dependent dehydrogenase (short-subunit alcohol dehydrogenase family)
MDRLKDKVAVVTGAGSGIGRATAKRFAGEGAAVVVTDVLVETAQSAVDEIERAGGRAIAMAVDVGDGEQVKAMIAGTLEAFGRIDVLHNNAANTSAADSARDRTLLDFDEDIFRKAMDINVLGGVLASKHALPHMIAQGSGSIIFTSSSISLGADIKSFSYGSSKAALNWFVKAFAVNYGKLGVRCNGLLPGIIETPPFMNWVVQTPGLYEGYRSVQNAPRFGTPEDVAAAALFLASDEAAFVNGVLLLVDGGMTCTIPFTNVSRDFMAPDAG